MYFRTVTRANPHSRATPRCVRPSTSTLCRTTCMRSILSILQRTPDPSLRQVRHQALRWPTFRAAFGLLSERRAQESRMVKESAPALGPAPAGQLRRVPDKFAAMRRLEEERKKAEAQNRAAEREWRRAQSQQ